MGTTVNIAITCAVVSIAGGCRSDAEPLERLTAGNAPSLVTVPPPPPPPPPPGGVRPPGPRPPPDEIAAALRGGECVPHVIILDLVADDRRGARFMGFRERARRTVDDKRSIELAVRLLRDDSYIGDGDVGCVSNAPTGIRIECGDATLDLVEDCTHLYLTDRGHDGPWVLASGQLADFIHTL